MNEQQPTQSQPEQQGKSKLGGVKLAFIYVLIGGLILSALIAVSAILIGEFNDIMQKALGTTAALVVHSLLILGFISSDDQNSAGRSLLPTVILASIAANTVTTTFGIWELLSDSYAMRFFNLYMLLIGSAFIAQAILSSRRNHGVIMTLVYIAEGLLGLFTGLVAVWLLASPELIGEFFYRLTGAVSVLLATVLSILGIMHHVVTAKSAALGEQQPKPTPLANGTIGMYIVIGIIVGYAWLYGIFGFIVASSSTSDPYKNRPYDTSPYSNYYQ